MGWTSLIWDVKENKVLIIGSGEVGERRALRFLESDAKVIIIGGTVSEKLLGLGAKEKPIHQLQKWVEWADLVVIASGDEDLNNKAAHFAGDKFLNRADHPLEGNIIVPTTFWLGDAQISIFTGGKSPLMARILRKKIQETITEEDILQIELQHYAREILKELIPYQKERRAHLYQILNSSDIKELIEAGKIEEAKTQVREYLRSQELKINQD